jgi:hypothetical protein
MRYPAQQLSVALRFYARASFQIDIGDMCGVSQATVCRAIHHVTAAICARRRDFMHFPVTPVERITAAEDFYQIAGFPGVVGAIDGSHIAMHIFMASVHYVTCVEKATTASTLNLQSTISCCSPTLSL